MATDNQPLSNTEKIALMGVIATSLLGVLNQALVQSKLPLWLHAVTSVCATRIPFFYALVVGTLVYLGFSRLERSKLSKAYVQKIWMDHERRTFWYVRDGIPDNEPNCAVCHVPMFRGKMEGVSAWQCPIHMNIVASDHYEFAPVREVVRKRALGERQRKGITTSNDHLTIHEKPPIGF